MAHIPASERRKQLIEAASKVISAKGVSGATTRAIASEANAALASLHYVFSNKEDIFIELLRWSVTFDADDLGTSVVPAQSGLEAAAKQLIMHWRAVDRPLIFAQFELLLWSMRTEVIEDEAASLYVKLVEQVAGYLRTAATSDEMNADFNKLAKRLLVVVDGIQFGSLCAGSSYIDDQEAMLMTEAVIRSR